MTGNYLLVEMLQENEAGGGAYDGGQATNGGSIGYAQREALADHLVMVGLVLLLVQFLFLRAGGQDAWFFLPKENQGISQSAWGCPGHGARGAGHTLGQGTDTELQL